jgi:hypothetical protein
MRVVLSLAGLVFCLGLAAGAAPAAEQLPWDQKKVTSLAKDLVPAVNDAYQAILPGQLGDMDPNAFYRLREILRRVRGESRRLASLLEKGEGHDPTWPVFEQLAMQVRNAQELVSRLFVPESLSSKLGAAKDIVREITPFYKKPDKDKDW